MLLYSFYKNITFSLANLWFGFFSGFSAQVHVFLKNTFFRTNSIFPFSRVCLTVGQYLFTISFSRDYPYLLLPFLIR